MHDYRCAAVAQAHSPRHHIRPSPALHPSRLADRSAPQNTGLRATRFVGHLDHTEQLALLRRADAAVPSHYEPFKLVAGASPRPATAGDVQHRRSGEASRTDRGVRTSRRWGWPPRCGVLDDRAARARRARAGQRLTSDFDWQTVATATAQVWPGGEAERPQPGCPSSSTLFSRSVASGSVMTEHRKRRDQGLHFPYRTTSTGAYVATVSMAGQPRRDRDRAALRCRTLAVFASRRYCPPAMRTSPGPYRWWDAVGPRLSMRSTTDSRLEPTQLPVFASTRAADPPRDSPGTLAIVTADPEGLVAALSKAGVRRAPRAGHNPTGPLRFASKPHRRTISARGQPLIDLRYRRRRLTCHDRRIRSFRCQGGDTWLTDQPARCWPQVPPRP